MRVKILILILLYCFNGNCSKIYLPLDTMIKYSPIIIEGKVINVTKPYYTKKTTKSKGGEIYRSVVVEVLKIFKGKKELQTEYVEIPLYGGCIGRTCSYIACGQANLPPLNFSGIFFLRNPKDTAQTNQFLSSPDTTPNKKTIYVHYDAYTYYNSSMRREIPVPLKNIERNFYRRIERITKIKREIVKEPEIEDEKARSFLISNNMSLRQKKCQNSV